jgi:hypothetical protein
MSFIGMVWFHCIISFRYLTLLSTIFHFFCGLEIINYYYYDVIQLVDMITNFIQLRCQATKVLLKIKKINQGFVFCICADILNVCLLNLSLRTDNSMTNGKVTKGQTIQWPTEKLQKDIQYNDQRKSYKRTDNTMSNGKVTKGHTIQWPTEKLQKDRQYNDQKIKTDNTMTKR